MKKFLPRSFKNPEGFTLIELLVVVAIIGILSVVGIVVFSGVQRNARDARRREDINALANAIEVKKNAGLSTYTPITEADFASGVIPTDPSGLANEYCISENGTTTPPAAPVGWVNRTACPAGPPAYLDVVNTRPTTAAVSWRVCALLEDNTTTYCKTNTQ